MITNIYSIPIYFSEVTYKDLIQQELNFAYENSNFEYNKIYRDSHKLSDTSFKNNIIEDFNCNNFSEELNYHLENYLGLIDSPVKINKLGYKVKSWITLNEPGDYTAQHNHGPSDISGVYYISASEESGELFFKNPNKAMISSLCFYHLDEVMLAKVKTGAILLFPGWLDHGVLSNKSSQKRISISFNITINRDGYF